VGKNGAVKKQQRAQRLHNSALFAYTGRGREGCVCLRKTLLLGEWTIAQ
jgi:hypothetical protein